MNKFIKFAVVAVMAVFATQTAQAQLLKNLLGGASSSTEAAAETKSSAYSSGQTSGAALKALYSQYKADGKNLNMNNMQNMLNLASLATNVQGLKTADSDYKKEFVKGLILGSTNLVTNNNSTSVLSSLTNFAKMDLSSLINAESLTEKAESAAKNAITSIITTATDTKKIEEKNTNINIENAAEIASSVSSLLNLFK
jgi:molybdopterin converting factor small subunit